MSAPVGLRPPSASIRKGTSAGQGFSITPLNTNISIGARPVTQQGLDGMRLRTAGPDRQIADKTYYQTQLRNKIADVSREMNNLKAEGVQLQRDASTYTTLERKYEERVAEVRLLEGQLADYNLAFDKIRTHTELSDIKAQFDRLQQNNSLERSRLDEVFLQRTEIDKRSKQINDSLEELQKKAESKFSHLDPSVRAEYVETLRENRRVCDAIQDQDNQLNRLEDRMYALQTELKKDIYIPTLKMTKLEEKLSNERARLEHECATALTPDQMRERLVQQVNQDNQAIKIAELKVKEYSELLEKYSEDLKQRASQIKDLTTNVGLLKKNDQLLERDRKITEFLNNFSTEQLALTNQKLELQNNVASLLQFISRGILNQQNLTSNNISASALGDMKDELAFKQEQTQNSESTLVRLKQELEKRQEELEKINTLDGKLSVEFSALTDRIQLMEKEMLVYANVDVLKSQHNDNKTSLMLEKQRTKSKRDALQLRVGFLGQNVDKLKQELQESDVLKKLEASEQKLRTLNQNIYSINESIKSRERESDYEAIMNNVMNICSQINQLLIKSNA